MLLCCVWLAFGNVFTLNFIFAFLSFLTIIFSVFYTQKKKILNLLNGASKEELEALVETYKSKQEKQEEEQEEFFLDSSQDYKNDSNFLKDPTKIYAKDSQNTQKNPLKKRKFLDNFSTINAKTGAKIFFFPLRLLTYVILIVGILILIRHQLFDTLAFFSGLIFANITTICITAFNLFTNLKSSNA